MKPFIQLEFCKIELFDWGCTTYFPDGTYVNATSHHDPHYYVISHRCGYSDNINQYCIEHEIAHSFLAEQLAESASMVLWNIAHNRKMTFLAASEESLVQTFQRWVRANERPIISDINWDSLKTKFLALFSEGTSNAQE